MFLRVFTRGISRAYPITARSHILVRPRSRLGRVVAYQPAPSPFTTASTSLSKASSADELIEEIESQYATAKDEFEIAYEETEKMSVYAEEDRKAAREELDKLEAAYKDAIENSEVGEEVRKRVGRGIRELANAVKNMEELALNQD